MKDEIRREQVRELMGQPHVQKDGVWNYQFMNGTSPFQIDFTFADWLKSVHIYANSFNLELNFNVETAQGT